MEYGHSYSLPTSAARARLSEIVTLVQDPRSYVVPTLHGKPVVAAVAETPVPVEPPKRRRWWQRWKKG